MIMKNIRISADPEMEESCFEYKCSYCTEEFCSNTNLENHMEKNHNGKIQTSEMDEKLARYKRSDCSQDFSSQNNFKVHFNEYHESVTITENPSILNFTYYYETIDEDLSFRRKLRKSEIQSFSSAEDFIDHLFSEDSNKKVNENISEIEKNLPEEMEVDVSKVQELYNCTECPMHFSSETLLMSHVGLMHDMASINENIKDIPAAIEKPYQCPICEESFSESQEISDHKTSQHKDVLSESNKSNHQNCTIVMSVLNIFH